jgi:hypothetical protein
MPRIETIVAAFLARAPTDPRLDQALAGVNDGALASCFIRVVCSLRSSEGPCADGQEVGGTLAAVAPGTPTVVGFCQNLVAPPAGAEPARPITFEDVEVVIARFVLELEAAGVSRADVESIRRELAPLGPQLVEAAAQRPG